VESLTNEQGNKIVGLQKGELTSMELRRSCENEKALDLQLLRLAEKLAT